MKKLYGIILFIVFLNIVNILFVTQGIFPGISGDQTVINDESEAEGLYTTWTDGDFGDMMLIFFGKAENIVALFAGLALSVTAAWITHSPAPFVVGMIGTVFLTLYNSTSAIFSNYPINNYIMLICSFGMIVLFVVTCAEYLTQGDA